jgi:hypothetical protein
MLFLATYPFSAEIEPPMSWLQFVDSMFGRLAWPLVVFVLAVMLRRQLAALAERVIELSFGGATVKFDSLLSEGAELIEQVEVAQEVAKEALQRPVNKPSEEPARIPASELPTDSKREDEILFDDGLNGRVDDEIDKMTKRIKEMSISGDDASEARAMLLYSDIEMALRRISETLEIPIVNPRRPWAKTIVSYLRLARLIDPELARLFDTLTEARNLIVHGSSGKISPAELAEFNRQAAYFALAVETLSARLLQDKRDGKLDAAREAVRK